MTELQAVQFNTERAHRIFPRPDNIKTAVYIPIAADKEGNRRSTTIDVSWGEQAFSGPWYGVLDETRGAVQYGSAKTEWLSMHTLLPGTHNKWVKTGVPTAYVTDEPCLVVTKVINPDGETFTETEAMTAAGDYIVRQPSGEVQHISSTKYDKIYYSDDEARTLGLDKMSDEQFANWVIVQITKDADAS